MIIRSFTSSRSTSMERCWEVICHISLLFTAIWYSKNIFVLACENLWCNRIYGLCHHRLSLQRANWVWCAFARYSLFTQSSSLFEHCVSGKLDYLQDKRKHMLIGSPTSDHYMLSCHDNQYFAFRLIPLRHFPHTYSISHCIDLISRLYHMCTAISKWKPLLKQQTTTHIQNIRQLQAIYILMALLAC